MLLQNNSASTTGQLQPQSYGIPHSALSLNNRPTTPTVLWHSSFSTQPRPQANCSHSPPALLIQHSASTTGQLQPPEDDVKNSMGHRSSRRGCTVPQPWVYLFSPIDIGSVLAAY
eukprot:1157426-Pelagomonas_calceolata.AAC.15